MHHSVSWLLDRVGLIGGHCRLLISDCSYSFDLIAGTQTNETTNISRGIQQSSNEFDARDGSFAVIVNDQLRRMCESAHIKYTEVSEFNRFLKIV